MVTVHDPQPAAMVMNGNIYGHTLWRCHIDTSNASRVIWRFLLPYINHYEGAIFTAPEFVKENLHIPTYEVSPSIDPLREKNKQRSRKEALKILEPVFNEHNIDAERPIVLAVSRYDIHKNQKVIIESFKLMKKSIAKGINPILVIMGNSATDDPEGGAIYEEVKKAAGDDKDIYLLLNVENNDEVVGSLMSIANCFVHISTKEGFGLVVTEAMWQAIPVIGSKVGGIPKQVINGINGILAGANETSQIAKGMQAFLQDKKLRDSFGQAAHKHVSENFLLPHMLRKELILMRYHLEIDNKIPDFRMNKLTYREIIQALYSRKSWPFSTEDLKKHTEAL